MTVSNLGKVLPVSDGSVQSSPVPASSVRLGVILRKGLLGVDGLAKKGLQILFQIRDRERTGAARMPKPKNLGRYTEKGSGAIVFDLLKT